VSEDKLQREARKGGRAKALLEDEVLSEAFKTLEQAYIRSWAGTKPDEALAREHFYRAVQILGDVRKHLASVAADGRVAQRQLDQMGGLNRL
jgi:putative heme iron utilization protein